jgi:hypothetical protein
MSCLLNCITETTQVTDGRKLVSQSLGHIDAQRTDSNSPVLLIQHLHVL